MSGTRTIGTVYLVGAGPGDPELLTLRAARLLMAARVIVHDGLVDPAILAMARQGARLISVAKRRSRHAMPQEAINALLIHEARQGNDVIRLKGGDPFVFGRGGEELAACRAAGVPVEVVPGVSAGLGAGAAAHIPLTHRGLSSAVTFVAGQCKGLTEQDWRGFAGPGRTLVIYMGVATAGEIAAKLLADGLPAATPVAVVENACRPEMRVVRAAVGWLGDLVARNRVQSPAVIIVGEVAGAEALMLETLAEQAA